MFQLDLLSQVSMAAYALLALITILSAPRQDLRDKRQRLSFVLVVGGNLLAYAAGSNWIFAAGWALAAAPFFLDREAYGKSVRLVHLASVASLVAGLSMGSQPVAAFTLLALAALLRKGIFPLHFWVPRAFEKGSLPFLSLFLNAHIGAYLMIRYAEPHFASVASQSLTVLGFLAIFTSLYCAIVALVARRPRRILALLCTGQSAFILAGLENRNVEGITGALLHWWAVAFATTAMLSVYRALEVRTTDAASPDGFLGLGFHAPRLAVLFSVSALALVGLPGTLGFVAEDLLFHGSLESHPLLGIGLPLATALNAITALRLLSNLFMGRRGIHVPFIPDATSRERWALTLPVVLLVSGGILPDPLLALRLPTAQRMSEILSGTNRAAEQPLVEHSGVPDTAKLDR